MSGENNGFRICKKCLIREKQGKELESLQMYIDNIEVELRASEMLYEERLEVCKNCEMLLAGMCRSCGCYVELRAAVEKNTCPRKKW